LRRWRRQNWRGCQSKRTRRFQSQVPSRGSSDTDDAVFERQGRVIDGVVFDPEFADAKALASRFALTSGVKPTSGPTVGSPAMAAVRGNATSFSAAIQWSPGQRFLDAIVIVGDFERAEVEFADVCRFERIFASALAALERLHEP